MGITIVMAITLTIVGMIGVRSSELVRPPKFWPKFIGWTLGLFFCSGAALAISANIQNDQAEGLFISTITIHAVPLAIGIVFTMIGIAMVKSATAGVTIGTSVHRFGIGGLIAAMLTSPGYVGWELFRGFSENPELFRVFIDGVGCL